MGYALILGIDPGPTEGAYILWDGTRVVRRGGFARGETHHRAGGVRPSGGSYIDLRSAGAPRGPPRRRGKAAGPKGGSRAHKKRALARGCEDSMPSTFRAGKLASTVEKPWLCWKWPRRTFP